jgi:hypothetical protein
MQKHSAAAAAASATTADRCGRATVVGAAAISPNRQCE